MQKRHSLSGINMNKDEILDKLQLENIELASTNKRALAFGIDELIISLLFTFAFWDKFSSLSSAEAIIGFINSMAGGIVLIKIAYQGIFVWMYGATLGKMAMKIKVISSADLDKPNFTYSFLRALSRVISEMLFYIGFIWAYFNPVRLTWHDKFAKTLVVNA